MVALNIEEWLLENGGKIWEFKAMKRIYLPRRLQKKFMERAFDQKLLKVDIKLYFDIIKKRFYGQDQKLIKQFKKLNIPITDINRHQTPIQEGLAEALKHRQAVASKYMMPGNSEAIEAARNEINRLNQKARDGISTVSPVVTPQPSIIRSCSSYDGFQDEIDSLLAIGFLLSSTVLTDNGERAYLKQGNNNAIITLTL